jgi:hypothetical protein
MQVDVELDSGKEEQFKYSEIPAMLPSQGHDSVLSISATSLDEHFEANPVMELADIMLSFGRVKVLPRHCRNTSTIILRKPCNPGFV